MYINSIENQGNNLARRIIQILGSYKIYIKIGNITPIRKGFSFEATALPGVWLDESKCEDALTLQLNCPFIQVRRNKNSFSIIVSQEESIDNRLIAVLKHPRFAEVTTGITIPWVVGFDYVNPPIIVDVAKLPTLMIGGASQYGKTFALRSLLVSVMWCCHPDKTQVLVIDGGAASLSHFRNVCAFVDDAVKGLQVITMLNNLIEERRRLSIENPDEFSKLKNIVIILDEYPALVTNCGNRPLLKETTQTLLQRGRHVKMFTVIAAQNPTKELLGDLDLGSVDARMAFHCPKEVNSRTILDVGGAEKLHEKGLALVKLPEHGGVIQKIKGSLVEPEEIPKILDEIRSKHEFSDYSFVVDEPLLLQGCTESSVDVVFSTAIVVDEKEVANKLFAEVLMWALGRKTASGNAIDKAFSVGERGGAKLISKLHDFKIVGEQVTKNPRGVIPNKIEDLTPEAIAFLEKHGHTVDDINGAFESRGGN